MMNPYDKVLEQKGLKYEELTPEEKELYQRASKGVKAVTVEDLKDHLEEMLYTMTMELCDTPDTPDLQDKNNKLKARVKNYLLLRAFIEVPDKVARAIQREIEETQ